MSGSGCGCVARLCANTARPGGTAGGACAARAPRAVCQRRPHRVEPAGWLGVGVAEISGDRARALKLKEDTAVEITHVEENSPAAKAGLKEHDVILEVNNQKMDDSEQFVRTIGETAPGSKVALVVGETVRGRT